MKVEYRPYQPKRVLNRHKHTDGPWFWLRYTAYPYIGCEHACEYCYTVMDKYCHFDEPEDFYRIIKVKTKGVVEGKTGAVAKIGTRRSEPMSFRSRTGSWALLLGTFY